MSSAGETMLPMCHVQGELDMCLMLAFFVDKTTDRDTTDQRWTVE